MPIYEYECLENGHRFEVLQKMSDDPIQVCSICGGKVRKVISAAGFMLKGSGWYKDGYSSNKPQASSSDSASTSTSTESKPVESKPAESKKAESSATPNNNKEKKS